MLFWELLCLLQLLFMCLFATNVKTVVIDTTIAVDNDDATNTVVIVVDEMLI